LLLYDGSWDIESNMFFPQLKIHQSPFVLVIRHPVTDTFLCIGSSILDNCPKLLKLPLHLFWGLCKIFIHILYRFHLLYSSLSGELFQWK